MGYYRRAEFCSVFDPACWVMFFLIAKFVNWLHKNTEEVGSEIQHKFLVVIITSCVKEY